MLHTSTLSYLKLLNQNNNRPWFEDHRSDYENAKNDFNLLVQQLINGIGKFDKDIANLSIKDCVFRQYRDVRFAKDKRPYKNNMGAYFNAGGKKLNTAGYYLHIEPGKSFVAGGLYQPEAPLLATVRQEIDYNLDEWKKILNTKTFEKYFPAGLGNQNMITRPPKGYNNDNLALEYLKHKSFTVTQFLPDEVLLVPGLNALLLNSFRSLKPMLDFLNRAPE